MGFEPTTFCMASSRWVCRGPAKCLQTNDFRRARPRAGVPRIVRRCRGLRQATDNERSLALGGSAGSRVAVESAPASTVREPDSCCSSRRRPRRTNPAAHEGAAQPLLVHKSSSDERADSALADTFVSSGASAWSAARLAAARARSGRASSYPREGAQPASRLTDSFVVESRCSGIRATAVQAVRSRRPSAQVHCSRRRWRLRSPTRSVRTRRSTKRHCSSWSSKRSW
jgi:hypothetical protein